MTESSATSSSSVRANAWQRLTSSIALLANAPWTDRAVLALALVLLAVANLPWHLDNYDQAKQAWVAYEIHLEGNWLLQHTPKGEIASKPPLMGWISAVVQPLTGWHIAWRIPSFVAALGILFLLRRAGRSVLPTYGAMLATAAFTLNLFTPRLATLVRTDMLLSLCIFVVGWLIWKKLSEQTPWSTAEKLAMFAAMTAANLTKGPVLYAFIVPGLVVFWFLAHPRSIRKQVWSGWWTWVLPFLLLVAWAGTALALDQEFYNRVVVEELLSRFHSPGIEGEIRQPFWFYFPHLIHKFIPWSLLLILLVWRFREIRRALRDNPADFWLVCWALGGLILMTILPSKRIDRIYPVVPPLALLTVVMIARAGPMLRETRIWAGGTLVAALLWTCGYFGGLLITSYLQPDDLLERFAKRSIALANERNLGPVEIIRANDEGMVMYLGRERFLPSSVAIDQWGDRSLNAVIATPKMRQKLEAEFGPMEPTLELHPERKNEKTYFLFLRDEQPPSE